MPWKEPLNIWRHKSCWITLIIHFILLNIFFYMASLVFFALPAGIAEMVSLRKLIVSYLHFLLKLAFSSCTTGNILVAFSICYTLYSVSIGWSGKHLIATQHWLMGKGSMWFHANPHYYFNRDKFLIESFELDCFIFCAYVMFTSLKHKHKQWIVDCKLHSSRTTCVVLI